MNAMQTFRPVKSEINITYQKSFFMRKRSLINVLDKKCDFALCISKIDVKAMCEFQLAWFFFQFFNKFLRDYYAKSVFSASSIRIIIFLQIFI